jgi:hypothetical protein
MAKRERSGVSGTLKIIFAIPTDDAKVWRLKNGSITFENGSTADMEVEGGYIPHAKGPHGLTVTYCVFGALKNQGSPVTGDVTMMTCVDGRVMDSVDVAQAVEVILPSDMAETLSGGRHARGLTAPGSKPEAPPAREGRT